MIKVITYETGHLDFFDLSDDFIGVTVTKEELKEVLPHRISLSVISDNVVIALVGLIEIYQGCYEAWLIPSKQLKNHGKSIIRTLRTLLKRAFSELKAHRVCAIINEKLHLGIKWAHLLGFVCEGKLRHYNKEGHNYYMYSLVVTDGR